MNPYSGGDRLERAGRYAEPAIVAPTDVEKRWLVRIDPYDSPDFARLSGQATMARTAPVRVDMQMDLVSHSSNIRAPDPPRASNRPASEDFP